MVQETLLQRRTTAAEIFNQQEHRDDGARVAASLGDGMTVLRDALYRRAHHDVQRIIGADSMLAPLSEEKSKRLAKTEIELFHVAVSAATVRDFGYVSDSQWYLDWLAEFRVGRIHGDAKVRQRLAYYLSKSSDGRRLAFSDVLANALPESRKAPLVLFQLAAPAVQIVTALAFGDHSTAMDARNLQATYLPAINDCRLCHGKLMENGDLCRECGNPLWKFSWLMAAD